MALTQPDPIRQEFLQDTESFSQPDSTSSKLFHRGSFGRVTCRASVLHCIRKVESVLNNMLVPFKLSLELGQFSFQTVDGRKCPLAGTINLQSIGDQCLIIIRKTRGNPLEYTRFFKYLVDQINN